LFLKIEKISAKVDSFPQNGIKLPQTLVFEYRLQLFKPDMTTGHSRNQSLGSRINVYMNELIT